MMANLPREKRMKTKLIASMVLGAMLMAGSVRAGDPNPDPDVAKAIQEIAARRAEKDEAKVKQVEARQKGEAREGGWQPGAAQGQAINPAKK